MKKEYEILFTPAKIGNCEIKNRFVMEPMEGTSMISWLMAKGYDPDVHDLLVERAKDGVGLIIPGAVFVLSTAGHQWVSDHPEAFQGVKETMDEIHSYGSKCFFQLSCGLGRNFPLTTEIVENYDKVKKMLDLEGSMATADAGLPNVWAPQIKTSQLTAEQIQDYVHCMAETAYLCKQNGVDGVDVHAVHEGYLLDQFTLPYTNHRTDEYGGTLENRLRFVCDVVKAIKARCGQDYPVTLRFSVTSRTKDFNHGIIPQDTKSVEIGRTLDEAKKAIQILSDAGFDGFNTDNGTYDAWYYAHPPVYMPLNCNLKESEEVKPYTDKPIICAGRMQLDAAAKAISEGKIDMVGIARQFLTDPQYLTKIREDKLEEIRPCISCHIGCFALGLWKDSGAVADLSRPTGICALNPYTRNEKKYAVVSAKEPKKIAVIGGGIAGMEFALQAAKRGHSVTLYEKSGQLGGVFIQAARFSFKEKDRDLLAYYRNQIAQSSVEVKMNTEVHSLDELDADDIVIATGSAKTRTLQIGEGKAITAVDFLKGDMSCGDKVAIIGGGLTGCEIAYELALQGKHPYIIEMQKDILMIPGSCMANTNFLRDAFDYYGVERYTSATTEKIEEDSITIKLEDGTEKTLPMDDCIVSIGYEKGVPFQYDESKGHVYTIGDASRVSNLMNAIWGANDLVLEHFQ